MSRRCPCRFCRSGMPELLTARGNLSPNALDVKRPEFTVAKYLSSTHPHIAHDALGKPGCIVPKRVVRTEGNDRVIVQPHHVGDMIRRQPAGTPMTEAGDDGRISVNAE